MVGRVGWIWSLKVHLWLTILWVIIAITSLQNCWGLFFTSSLFWPFFEEKMLEMKMKVKVKMKKVMESLMAIEIWKSPLVLLSSLSCYCYCCYCYCGFFWIFFKFWNFLKFFFFFFFWISSCPSSLLFFFSLFLSPAVAAAAAATTITTTISCYYYYYYYCQLLLL